MQSSSFSKQMAYDISHSSLIDEFKKATLQLRLHQLDDKPLNILFAGPQGVGKTSTIKALFGEALVPAVTSESEIQRYEAGNLTVWDYPGHNGNAEHDRQLDMQIGATLSEQDAEGNPLVDMVVVVMDAAQQNLNEGYRLITDIMIPALGENFDSRLVVALNKIDVASYGYEWDYIADRPSPEVEVWPESTASLLRHCILDESGLEIAPVCFAAGFTRTNELSPRPFNLLKLFGAMLGKLPAEKQLTLINSPLNSHSLAWFDSDDRRNYLVEVENVLFDTLYEGSRSGARFGGLLGAYLGKQGREIGYLLRRNLRNKMNLL